MAESQAAGKKHVLMLDGREKLSATGVAGVDYFSGELVTARTAIGQLNIKGENLHIDTVNSETGELLVTGKIAAVSYSQAQPAGGFWARLLR